MSLDSSNFKELESDIVIQKGVVNRENSRTLFRYKEDETTEKKDYDYFSHQNSNTETYSLLVDTTAHNGENKAQTEPLQNGVFLPLEDQNNFSNMQLTQTADECTPATRYYTNQNSEHSVLINAGRFKKWACLTISFTANVVFIILVCIIFRTDIRTIKNCNNMWTSLCVAEQNKISSCSNHSMSLKILFHVVSMLNY